jgi:VWFA-related protein
MRRLAAAIALLLALSSVLSAGQTGQQENPFRIQVGVDLVSVNFSATDSKGRFIPGLTQKDFVVEEDGKVQTLTAFSRERELPLTLALLVDVSLSVVPLFEKEKATAAAFLKSIVGPRDLALIMSIDRDVVLVQNFTEDVNLLTAALQKLKIAPGTSIYDAVYLAASEKLSKEVGRKAIVLISDGEDTTSEYSVSQAMIAVHNSNTVIYAISNGGNSGTMRRMAEETGGAFFRIREEADFEEVFSQIALELRTQYSIAYHSTNLARDGAFRRIKIVPADSNIKIRARRGYYAPRSAGSR